DGRLERARARAHHVRGRGDGRRARARGTLGRARVRGRGAPRAGEMARHRSGAGPPARAPAPGRGRGQVPRRPGVRRARLALVPFALALSVLGACTIALPRDEGAGTTLRVPAAGAPRPALRLTVRESPLEFMNFCMTGGRLPTGVGAPQAVSE